jgi:hypothetical protein
VCRLLLLLPPPPPCAPPLFAPLPRHPGRHPEALHKVLGVFADMVRVLPWHLDVAPPARLEGGSGTRPSISP